MEHIKKKELTKAQIERGVGILSSVKIVINVLYALMIFQTFLILPRPDDPELEYHTLSQIYSENIMQIVTIVVGLILIIIYWIQFNKQLGNLTRSSPTHATLAVAQMFCLMLYLYFVRFDMAYDGMKLALQMQSTFLALAGFIGIYNWLYARKNRLTSDQINEEEELSILFGSLPEPIASLISLPFAVLGPAVWTLSFLTIIPLSYIFNLINKRQNRK
jgi:succinate dehydrogenase hydrophobic anchor subunit